MRCNVLNSLNVSAILVADQLRGSRVSGLLQAVQLIYEHSDELAIFLTEDQKGKRLPSYLLTLTKHLSTEQQAMIKEINLIMKNIQPIKHIVARQQSYAGNSSVIEPTSIAELVDDAWC